MQQIVAVKLGSRDMGITTWPAEKAFLMHLELVKFLGPIIGEITKNFESDFDPKNVKVKDIDFNGIVSSIYKVNTSEQITSLVKEILDGCAIGGVKLNKDNVFEAIGSESMTHIYLACFHVIKANFSNFIPASLESKMKEKFGAVLERFEDK